ncbi:pectinesterase family protein [Actinoplanes sichuanensis]|uniref:Pectinesterase n=1 Tax=Actinoplanes sichuanensis TaxID=512349 RepID=A0ABW4AM69_9ACTN|nr:pectinesterase family protein [Actinoplanes sichuanensis]BEL08391.1 pectinesterase family protein [Actinoplanes sichuanensis]
MRRRTFLGMSSGLGIVATGLVQAPATAGVRRPDLIVASDGSGDHTGIQAAIDAAPAGATEPYVIGVRPGTYLGQVIVPSAKTQIELRGLGRRPEDVVIADDRANGTPKPTGGTWGTSGSASVTVDGAGFRAGNLTFANLFDEAAHPEITNRQAVAVLTRADRLVFERVRFLANQDTLYVNSSAAGVIARVYLRDCYVEGDVDFIFGRATAVFDRCRVHSLNRGTTPNGYVTAPSTDLTNPHGLLFDHCRFTSDAPAGTVLLGRPWHPSNDPNAIGQTVIRRSWIGTHIPDLAWSDFGTWPWREARFAEYRNYGPGALISENRPQLTDEQAAFNTIEAFLRGPDGWRPDRC